MIFAGTMGRDLPLSNPAPGVASGAGSRAAEQPRELADADLVAAVRGGDSERFGELVARHEGLVFAHLFRLLRRREDAEDLAQEAFVLAYRKLDSFDAARPFRPWLLRIATNLALTHLRRKRPDCSLAEIEDELERLPDQRAASPRDRAARGERDNALASAIEALPPVPRTIVHLKYREELSLEEIATALGKTPGAVAVMLHRARLTLRSMPILDDHAGEGGRNHGA